jgi:hypothetical protein
MRGRDRGNICSGLFTLSVRFVFVPALVLRILLLCRASLCTKRFGGGMDTPRSSVVSVVVHGVCVMPLSGAPCHFCFIRCKQRTCKCGPPVDRQTRTRHLNPSAHHSLERRTPLKPQRRLLCGVRIDVIEEAQFGREYFR